MNDFLIGAVSGMGQVITGHPLDTIKVRMQNNVPIHNMKLKHYYRGITYPLISSSIVNSIIFGVYHNTIDKTNNSIVSGFISGLVCSPVVYAFDVYKTKRQMNSTVSHTTLLTSRGFFTSISRESIAFSSYFSSYNYLKDSGLNPLVSGGIAGLLNWALTYPIDVIRNRQIALNIPAREAYNMGHLWKGFSICSTRAIIVNAVGFYIYEEGKKLISNKSEFG